MHQPLAIIVLAAGKGTRMKSSKAKVLHEVFYAPMVEHVLRSTNPLNSQKTVVVVGHQKDTVQQKLDHLNVHFAEQKEQLGTGHAVLAAEKTLHSFSGTVMILCGDTPLIRPEMLLELLEVHRSSHATVTLLTTHLENPANYGRILSDTDGNVRGIVEHKDANKEQLAICEINAGMYCVESDFLFSTLKNVGTDNSQGEVYLTDIVHMAVENNLPVRKYAAPDAIDVLGVNSRLELSQAQSVLQHRLNESLMASGVSMINPASIRIAPDSVLQPDVLIEPNVHIFNNTTIGGGSIIEQGSVLQNCTIGQGAVIGASCCLTGITVGDNEVIAPLTLKR